MLKAGQKVLCIKQHPSKCLYVGATYTIKQTAAACECFGDIVDVGIPNRYPSVHCPKCGWQALSEGVAWLTADHFAPLEEKSETMVESVLREISIPEKERHKN